MDFDMELNGSRAKRNVAERRDPTIGGRLWFALGGTRSSTYGPTPNIRNSFDIARSEFAELRTVLEDIVGQQLPEMERALVEAGAPWIEGQPIPE
jgi:hypothetical protein